MIEITLFTDDLFNFESISGFFEENVYPEFCLKNIITKNESVFKLAIIKEIDCYLECDFIVKTINPQILLKTPIKADPTLSYKESIIKGRYDFMVLLGDLRKKLLGRTVKGKVRDLYTINENILALLHSDRQSAFDKHICNIPGKGQLLTSMSAKWFRILREKGISNHYLNHYSNVLFVKRCKIFPIEIVVRAYITGSTKTSLWEHYRGGERSYCGIELPEGLVKNQKLPQVIITPTTKGEVDEPISSSEIIERSIVGKEDLVKIYRMAYSVFAIGQEYAKKRGLILVDTKYEFGVDEDGEIMLCDEVHTFDSSRFWVEDTYSRRFLAGKDPERFDKDLIREYVVIICNPYEDDIPEISEDMIKRVWMEYKRFYEMLFGEEYILMKNIDGRDDLMECIKTIKDNINK